MFISRKLSFYILFLLMCSCANESGMSSAEFETTCAREIHHVKDSDGEGVVRVVAYVGNEVISNVDVETKVRMLLSNSKSLPKDLEESLYAIALDQIIEECAKSVVSSSIVSEQFFALIDKFAEEEYEKQAYAHGQTVEQYESVLLGYGISPVSLRRFIRWRIAWEAAVESSSKLSDDLVRKEAQRRVCDVQDINTQHFFVSRIIVHNADILRQVQNLVEQGYPFYIIANLFSSNSVAQRGGCLGVVGRMDLSPEEYAALLQMKADEVRYVRCAEGVSVLLLHQKVDQPDYSEVKFFTIKKNVEGEIDSDVMSLAEKELLSLYEKYCGSKGHDGADAFHQALRADPQFSCSEKKSCAAQSLIGIEKKMCAQIPNVGLSEANYSSDGVRFMCIVKRQAKSLRDIAESEMYARVMSEYKESASYSLWKKYCSTVKISRL